jgi:hypothetical protein
VKPSFYVHNWVARVFLWLVAFPTHHAASTVIGVRHYILFFGAFVCIKF